MPQILLCLQFNHILRILSWYDICTSDLSSSVSNVLVLIKKFPGMDNCLHMLSMVLWPYINVVDALLHGVNKYLGMNLRHS